MQTLKKYMIKIQTDYLLQRKPFTRDQWGLHSSGIYQKMTQKTINLKNYELRTESQIMFALPKGEYIVPSIRAPYTRLISPKIKFMKALIHEFHYLKKFIDFHRVNKAFFVFCL